MAVEHWLNGEPNLGILITVNDKWENRIFPNFLKSIRRGIYRPFLLVYKGKTSKHNRYYIFLSTLCFVFRSEEWCNQQEHSEIQPHQF